jgi:pyruvate formate lyase activating enzyme
MLGKYMTVGEVLYELQKDSCFYCRSEGGLTVSGGEPLLQPEFSRTLLKAARNAGIETAVETCGHVHWEQLASVCEHVGSIFYDIKSLDPRKHQRFTQVSNDLILQNFTTLARTFPQLPITVRTPVVSGFNDDPEEVVEIARFVTRYSNVTYELMPYHGFGESKYRFLGRPYELASLQSPTTEQMRLLRSYINRIPNG